jgi:hypothetical protein
MDNRSVIDQDTPEKVQCPISSSFTQLLEASHGFERQNHS